VGELFKIWLFNLFKYLGGTVVSTTRGSPIPLRRGSQPECGTIYACGPPCVPWSSSRSIASARATDAS